MSRILNIEKTMAMISGGASEDRIVRLMGDGKLDRESLRYVLDTKYNSYDILTAFFTNYKTSDAYDTIEDFFASSVIEELFGRGIVEIAISKIDLFPSSREEYLSLKEVLPKNNYSLIARTLVYKQRGVMHNSEVLGYIENSYTLIIESLCSIYSLTRSEAAEHILRWSSRLSRGIVLESARYLSAKDIEVALKNRLSFRQNFNSCLDSLKEYLNTFSLWMSMCNNWRSDYVTLGLALSSVSTSAFGRITNSDEHLYIVRKWYKDIFGDFSNNELETLFTACENYYSLNRVCLLERDVEKLDEIYKIYTKNCRTYEQAVRTLYNLMSCCNFSPENFIVTEFLENYSIENCFTDLNCVFIKDEITNAKDLLNLFDRVKSRTCIWSNNSILKRKVKFNEFPQEDIEFLVQTKSLDLKSVPSIFPPGEVPFDFLMKYSKHVRIFNSLSCLRKFTPKQLVALIETFFSEDVFSNRHAGISICNLIISNSESTEEELAKAIRFLDYDELSIDSINSNNGKVTIQEILSLV